MSRFISALKNNINEKQYLSFAYRTELLNDCDSMIPIESRDVVAEELDDLMVKTRRGNLKVFASSYLGLKGMKFMLYTAPALIVAANIAAWTFGTNDVVTEEKAQYSKTVTMVDNKGNALVNKVDNVYSGFAEPDFVDKSNEFTESPYDKIYYTVTGIPEGYRMSFSHNSDGAIRYNSSQEDFFKDFDTKLEPNEAVYSKYADLFDDIVTYVKDENKLTKSRIEYLEGLSENEKATIILEIIDYEYLGNKEVDVYSDHVLLKILLGALAFIYGIGLSEAVKNGEHYLYDSLTVDKETGKLQVDKNKQDYIKNLEIKYKELFMAAERIRIKKAYEKVNGAISDEDISGIFTRYEQALIEENEPKKLIAKKIKG